MSVFIGYDELLIKPFGVQENHTNKMGIKDLEKILNVIEVDSMSRDRIFYDMEMDKKEFYKLVNKLSNYLLFYLENEDKIIKEWEESNKKNDITDNPFLPIMKQYWDNE